MIRRIRFLLWMWEFRRIAGPNVQWSAEYLHSEHWREYFDDGYTPREAFDSDSSYWAEST
jgi:hypothetical protein